MFRPICFVFMVAAVLTAASEARAQYGYARGYGGYGWGGWGGASTPGSCAAGHGYVGNGRRHVQPRHGPSQIHQCQHRNEMGPGHVQRQ